MTVLTIAGSTCFLVFSDEYQNAFVRNYNFQPSGKIGVAPFQGSIKHGTGPLLLA
jgi:hypothetical protein